MFLCAHTWWKADGWSILTAVVINVCFSTRTISALSSLHFSTWHGPLCTWKGGSERVPSMRTDGERWIRKMNCSLSRGHYSMFVPPILYIYIYTTHQRWITHLNICIDTVTHPIINKHEYFEYKKLEYKNIDATLYSKWTGRWPCCQRSQWALVQVQRPPTFWLIALDKLLTLWCPCSMQCKLVPAS